MIGLERLELQDRPEPEPSPRQVVVEVRAVGVCGSDTAYFTRGRIGSYVVDGPIVLGHEAAGQVVAVGDAVGRVRPGDRVAIEPGTPCRDCRECMAGRYHLCPDLVFLATPPYDGALVQRLVIDERNLFVLPDTLSYEEGALLEPLSVGIWACQRAALRPGERVLVTGAGPVGMLAARAARAFGAGRVVLSDPSEFRRGLAAAAGFDVEVAGEATTGEHDVLLECSAIPAALLAGLGRLREAGRAAVVGQPKAPVSIPLAELNPKELTISLVNRYAHTWPVAIDLVASRRVEVASLVTHRFGLDESADALTLASRVSNSMKAVIDPQHLTTQVVAERPR